MLISRFIAIGALVVLAGCSGMNYAIQNYASVKPQRFDFAGENWRIFHKPSEKRLMITPSFSTALAGGAKTGLTFGLAGRQTDPENRFRTAAMMFVKQSVGENCEITSGQIVIDPQYEYNYSC